jgi:hypothetical protein
MLKCNNNRILRKSIILLAVVIMPVKMLVAQDLRFGIYASPVLCWFNTDIDEVKNQGARAGFIFGVSAEKYLTGNWYFNPGIAFINSSGRLKCTEPSTFRFPDHTSVVGAGDPVVYRIQYLAIPTGIKIKTSDVGYLTYFAEFGLDPKVVVTGKADIPSIDVSWENAMNEIRRFNIGYYLNAGADYSINGSISLILGLGYESNIIDTTIDIDGQPADRTFQKMLKFIFGIKF